MNTKDMIRGSSITVNARNFCKALEAVQKVVANPIDSFRKVGYPLMHCRNSYNYVWLEFYQGWLYILGTSGSSLVARCEKATGRMADKEPFVYSLTPDACSSLLKQVRGDYEHTTTHVHIGIVQNEIPYPTESTLVIYDGSFPKKVEGSTAMIPSIVNWRDAVLFPFEDLMRGNIVVDAHLLMEYFRRVDEKALKANSKGYLRANRLVFKIKSHEERGWLGMKKWIVEDLRYVDAEHYAPEVFPNQNIKLPALEECMPEGAPRCVFEMARIWQALEAICEKTLTSQDLVAFRVLGAVYEGWPSMICVENDNGFGVVMGVST